MKALLLASCLAAAPDMVLAQPRCSLPDALAGGQTSSQNVPRAPGQGAPLVLAQAPDLPLPGPAVTLPPSRPVAGSTDAATGLPPSLQHVAAAGATVTDMADYHGMRRGIARTGDQFMLLSATPDGQAVVAGLMLDLSASDLSQIAGGSLTELGMLHGLRGMLVKSGAQFQVFYATPDGQRVIPGIMWDADGKNLTRDQIAPVSGVIPTVIIGPAADVEAESRGGASPAAVQTFSALNIVQATNFGTIGSPSAPRLWMFIDPLCSFSVRAVQQLQPFVESGRVQLAVIPLAVIDHETNGRSTTNALAMLSRPAEQMVTAWSRGDLGGAPALEAATRLRANMAAAQAVRLEGTPTLIWRKADGSEGRSDGLPGDLNAVLASMGG